MTLITYKAVTSYMCGTNFIVLNMLQYIGHALQINVLWFLYMNTESCLTPMKNVYMYTATNQIVF